VEATYSSETMITTCKSTWCHNPEHRKQCVSAMRTSDLSQSVFVALSSGDLIQTEEKQDKEKKETNSDVQQHIDCV
jgi:hypothetical protein